MDSEKRLALCFVLSMLVMLGFNWYYAKKYPPKPHTSGARPTAVVPGQIGVRPTPTPASKEAVASATPESMAVGVWDWLPSASPSETGGEVVVESERYRIVFSKTGALPVEWRLLQYKELSADPRLLQLEAKKGDPLKAHLADLELKWRNSWLESSNPPVNAIDSNYAPGEMGLSVEWGGQHPDQWIPYQCSQERLVLEGAKPSELVFSYTNQGITVEKLYRFYPDSYHVDLHVRLFNKSGKPLAFDGKGYYDVLWRGGFGFPSQRTDAQNNALCQLIEKGLTTEPLPVLLKEIQKNSPILLPEYSAPTLAVANQTVGWAGVGQKYFLAAIVPKSPTKFALKGASSPKDDPAILKPLAGVRMNVDPIPDGMSYNSQYTVYVGPLEDDELIKADSSLQEARQIFWRSFTRPISHFMLRLLKGFYRIVPNYGVGIILLTLLVKVIMLPLYHKQMKSMKKMQALQPQINAMKEQYKDDPQKMQKAQMELFRKHKVNPLAGCLPMLPTIPIFIALYATFGMALELRGAHFFSWINDLSAPDGAFYLPFGGYIFTVNILPLAYAALMFWSSSQQKVEGPNANMMRMFPLIFVFFFWSIASGVILYFVISIFIDVMQRLVLERFHGKEPAAAK